ncbi:DNA primase [Anaerosporomusa subterranea]|jgi:ribonuclease M5|uniref:Ribonuclease M5 n=1 Tax=Anaerosporomusa subterranea TaxID=1794912 RepID=A0A154BQZ9_ANASB|nr:ribonuclease M5 [Anaerosporomusa subterranea]KYZ76295.1 DNA primase [Anaerosporomusa subterranea]MDF2500339.1 Primase-related protein [Anaerosporomusa subterranea]
MIKEVIVVEGKNDTAAVKRAVEADCLETGGFGLQPYRLDQIAKAAKARGLIILTDPDSAGERIRRKLTERFPEAKHAFIPKEAATADGDIGIEQAKPDAIRAALTKARCQEWTPELRFTWDDLMEAGLTGTPAASSRRAILGEKLGIGYANAKTFFHRLNTYGVSREEFGNAVLEMETKNASENR